MPKIAIIKIGATGDVVRTSVLLHLYKNDDIVWITARHNIPILPNQQTNLKRVVAIEEINSSGIFNEYFDLVISLDDDKDCSRVVSELKSKEIFGAFWEHDKIAYTSSSNEWFDMGLSSRFGKEKADQLKWMNKSSYQEILFRMLGHTFRGEEYIIPEDILSRGKNNIIGIEARAGARWPTKMWNKYGQLADMLTRDSNDCTFFKDRNDIRDYMQDIGDTSLVITGDTLAMHIALALKIPVVAIFTCTSAVEIYGYDRMEKVVSPFLEKAFYKTSYIPEAVDSVRLDSVYTSVKKLKTPVLQ